MKARVPYPFLKAALLLSIGSFTVASLFAQPLAMFPSPKADKSTYFIGSGSKLKLEGKTNINGFTCNYTEEFPPQTFAIERHEAETHTTVFRETELKLKIKSLDSGNKLMNKDMFKALNADAHPFIKIELIKVAEDKCNRLDELKDWVRVKALIKISINGRSNDYWLDITAKKISQNQFRFIGNKTLHMTDFGIEPPTSLMGMVKVKNEIKISLDLGISLD